jgi:hypothetical protein
MKSFIFWDITPRWKSTDVSDEHAASVFRVKEQAEQENLRESRWQSAFVLVFAWLILRP